LAVILDTVRIVFEGDANVTLNYKSTEFRTFFMTTMVPQCMFKLLQLVGVGDDDKVSTLLYVLRVISDSASSRIEVIYCVLYCFSIPMLKVRKGIVSWNALEGHGM
jgi:hypothetical protein